MIEYHELSPTHSLDARNAARRRSHPYSFSHVLDDPGRIERPPELSWTWDAPFPFPDWVLTNDTIRVFSPRMANLVREHLGPRDKVQWLPASVVTSDGVAHPHEVPHFLEYPDMYDEEATEWGPSGLPIRWVLSRRKLEGLRFFARPRAAGPVIVDETLLTAMREARLTGLDTRPVRITG